MVSSAYKSTAADCLSTNGKSLMKIKNNNGPRIEPWGIPHVTEAESDK